MTDAVQEVHDAFYRLTVLQRDAAWREVEQLQAEVGRLKALLAESVPAKSICHGWGVCCGYCGEDPRGIDD